MSVAQDRSADLIAHVRTHETCDPDCPAYRAKLKRLLQLGDALADWLSR